MIKDASKKVHGWVTNLFTAIGAVVVGNFLGKLFIDTGILSLWLFIMLGVVGIVGVVVWDGYQSKKNDSTESH